MSKFRLPIALLMMLWLPLRGVAAVAMPFCNESPQPVTDASASNPHHAHGHGGAVPSEDLKPSGARGTSETSQDGAHPLHLQCNDCGACHLACAPVLGVAAQVLCVPVSQHFSSLPQASPPARPLDQPHPPPLA
jgi:hypothetical protein